MWIRFGDWRSSRDFGSSKKGTASLKFYEFYKKVKSWNELPANISVLLEESFNRNVGQIYPFLQCSNHFFLGLVVVISCVLTHFHLRPFGVFFDSFGSLYLLIFADRISGRSWQCRMVLFCICSGICLWALQEGIYLIRTVITSHVYSWWYSNLRHQLKGLKYFTLGTGMF